MADFQIDGRQVILRFGVEDIHRNTVYFKTHREYIQHQFKQHGFEITKWNWDREPLTGAWQKDETGISFTTTDRQVDLTIEVRGIIGQNVREIRDVERIESTSIIKAP